MGSFTLSAWLWLGSRRLVWDSRLHGGMFGVWSLQAEFKAFRVRL